MIDERKIVEKRYSTDPMYVVQFLMFLKGRYWYGTDCCVDGDEGVFVSSTETPIVSCSQFDKARVPAEVSLEGDNQWKFKATLIEEAPTDQNVVLSPDIQFSILIDSVVLDSNQGGVRIVGQFQIARIQKKNGATLLIGYPTTLESSVRGSVEIVAKSNDPGYICMVNVECFRQRFKSIRLVTR